MTKQSTIMKYYCNKPCETGLSPNTLCIALILPLLGEMWGDKIPMWWDEVRLITQALWCSVRPLLTFRQQSGGGSCAVEPQLTMGNWNSGGRTMGTTVYVSVNFSQMNSHVLFPCQYVWPYAFFLTTAMYRISIIYLILYWWVFRQFPIFHY